MNNVVKDIVSKELIKRGIKPTITNILCAINFGWITFNSDNSIKENNL